jgi:hypothetical protein
MEESEKKEMGSRRNKMKKQSLRKTLLFRRKEKRAEDRRIKEETGKDQLLYKIEKRFALPRRQRKEREMRKMRKGNEEKLKKRTKIMQQGGCVLQSSPKSVDNSVYNGFTKRRGRLLRQRFNRFAYFVNIISNLLFSK